MWVVLLALFTCWHPNRTGVFSMMLSQSKRGKVCKECVRNGQGICLVWRVVSVQREGLREEWQDPGIRYLVRQNNLGAEFLKKRTRKTEGESWDPGASMETRRVEFR